MKKAWWVAIAPGILGAIVLFLLVVKLLWAWTIPDLFPGAVEQGLITPSVSWLTAFKVAIFFGVLTGGARGQQH